MRIHVFGKHLLFILSLLSPFSLNTLSYTSEIVTTMQNRDVYNYIKSLYVLESHEEILELMKDTMKSFSSHTKRLGMSTSLTPHWRTRSSELNFIQTKTHIYICTLYNYKHSFVIYVDNR